MAQILIVCTGNICRSPMAVGFLRSILAERFGDDAPEVVSAGTVGWERHAAVDESIRAAGERDVDITDHQARMLQTDHIANADLVVGMSGEHREKVVSLMPDAAAKTFTLKELVALLEEQPQGGSPSDVGSRVAAAEKIRDSGFEGNPDDEDVVDPLGLGFDTYRAVAWEIDEFCGRLVDGMFGKAPVRSAFEQD
ncbi:MAG: hypothetical protein WD276_08805 [Actinomycetota bacterium]